MGSTPIILTGNASAKSARMHQAQQVVKLFKVYTYVHVYSIRESVDSLCRDGADMSIV